MLKQVFAGTFALFCLIATQASAGEHLEKASKPFILASDGKAACPIVVSPKASPETREAAQTLAKYLTKISGAKFKVKSGNGKTGIAVGALKDFPEIPLKPRFDTNDPGERQGYEIKSHGNGVYIIGATPQAVNYAVYDLLFRFGYRPYFPMKKWEIIPKKKSLKLASHIREAPDYYYRLIWASGSMWREFRQERKPWSKANRADGFHLSSGHAYGQIIRRNKKEFEAHPEYLALRKGKRKGSKFCISNPGLRKLVADYAVNYFKKYPNRDTVSIEASDGGGWCECEECAKLGSVSDRVVLLANQVAKEVHKHYPDKRVGVSAYNMHSPPPTIDLHPSIIVNIAMGFIKGGYSIDELIEGWRGKKAEIGIRDYYDLYSHSMNAPGRGRADNTGYLKRTIPEYYRKGARYMNAEATDGWGSAGLDYFLAQRALWNVEETKRFEELTREFMKNCFGPAAETMGKFYELIDGVNKPRLTQDLIGRLYRLLKKARKEAAGNPRIISRLNDLAVYVRYSELLMDYEKASGRAKIAALTKFFKFAARIKNTQMVHTSAAYRITARRLFKHYKVKQPPEIDWKNSPPVTVAEIGEFIDKGIENNKLLNFKPVSYSEELEPAPALKTPIRRPGKTGLTRRGTIDYYIWFGKNPKPLELAVTGGLITKYRNRGNVKVMLYKVGGASDTGELETLIQTDDSVPPDGKTRTVTLRPKQAGLHKIVVSDGGDRTRVEWDKKCKVTVIPRPKKGLDGSFYFYVPKGTKTLGYFCRLSRGQIIAPGGEKLVIFRRTKGFGSVQIPPGCDGKVWRLNRACGVIEFLTVPNCLALSPSALLLPGEVVKEDHL